MMNKPPRIFQAFALLLVVSMAWANHRGYMFSSLFNPTQPASHTTTGQANHK